MKEDERNSIMEKMTARTVPSVIWERPASKRPKMPLSQRAKQFAPFDALTGLGERLRQAEEEHARQMEEK